MANPIDSIINEYTNAAKSLRSGLTPTQVEPAVRNNSSPTGMAPPADLLPLFEQASAEYGVPVNVLAAIAQQESSYNTQAVGQPTKWGRAKGLMQYIDPTAAGLGINPFDAKQSVSGAARQFKERMAKGYTLEEAIMAHHGGDDRNQWGPKTRQYVQDVMGKAGVIGGLLKGNAAPAPTDASFEQLQAELDAKEPGRFKVVSEEEAQRWQNRNELFNGGPTLAESMRVKQDQPSPLLPGAQRQVNPASPLTMENQERAKAGLPAKDTRPYQGFVDATGAALSNVPERFQQSIAGLIQMAGEDMEQFRQRDYARTAARMGMTPGDLKLLAWAGRQQLVDAKMPADQALKYVKENIAKALTPEQIKQLDAAGLINPKEIAEYGKAWRAETKKTEQEVRPEPGSMAFYGSAAIGSIAEMAPMIAAAIVTRSPKVASSIMAGQVGGQAYAQGREKGLDESQAQTYAVLTAAAEAVPEALVVGQLLKPGAGVVKKILQGSVLEGAQEAVTGALQAGIDQQMIEPDMTLKEALVRIRDGAIVGAMVGGGMGGVIAGADKLGQRKQAPQERIEPTISEPTPEAQQEAAPAQNDLAGMDTSGNSLIEPAQPTGPLSRAAAKAMPAADAERVTVQTQAGPIQGTLESFDQSPNGGWTARVLGDNGQLYQYNDKDGVTIQNEAQAIQPEPVADTQAQIDAIKDPSSAKDTALITPNSQPVDTEGLATIETNQGVVVTSNPEKAAAIEAKGGNLSTDEVGALLDYTTPKSETDGTVVQAADAAGNVVHEEATNAQSVDQAVAQAETMAPEGGAVQVLDAETAPANRAEKVAADIPVTVPRREERNLDDLSEPELRDRLKYLAGQAKASGGWNKTLMAERRKVEKAINAKSADQATVSPEAVTAPAPAEASNQMAVKDAAPTKAESPAAEAAPVKWFGTQEKADAFVAKKGMGDTHEVVPVSRSRFEIREKANPEGWETVPGFADRSRKEVMEAVTDMRKYNEGLEFRTRTAGGKLVIEKRKAVVKPELTTEQKPKVSREQAITEAQGAAAEVLSRGGTDAEATRAATDQLIDRMADDPGISIAADAPAAVEAAKQNQPSPNIAGDKLAKKAKALREKADRMEASGGDAQVIQSLRDQAQRDDPLSVQPVATTKVSEGVTATVIDPSAGRQQTPAMKWVQAGKDERMATLKAAGFTNESQLRVFVSSEFADLPTRVRDKLEGKQPEQSNTLQDGSKAIGRRADGKMIYEDKNGVRYYADSGVRIQETVSMRPTREGMVVERQALTPEFMTAEEHAAEAKPSAVEAARYLKDFVYSLDQLEGMTDKAQVELSSPLGKSGRDSLLMEAYGITRSQAHDINNEQDSTKPRKLRQQDMQEAFAIFPGLRRLVDSAIASAAARKSANPAEADLDAMFDDVLAEVTGERSAGEAAISAAKNAASALDDAINGLGALFGGNGRLSSGLTFDKETYEKAKPLFVSAVANMRAASQDLREAMQAVVKMVVERFGADTAKNMKPYVVRFIEDVRDGNVVLNANDEVTSNDTEQSSQVAGASDAGGEPGRVQADAEERQAGADAGEPDGAVRGQRTDGARPSDKPARGGRQPEQGGEAQQRVRGDRGNRAESGGRGDQQDYRIEPGELKRTGSWKATAEQNIRIVELVKQITAEKRQATPEERKLLTKFTGWGASEIANGVFPNQYGQFKPEWRELGERLKNALTPDEYAQAKRTTQYAHYTSEPIIRSVHAAMERLGFNGGQVLEPGMGVGLFKGMMPDAMAANSQYTGIEYDTITGNIAKLLYPSSNMIVGDYTQTKLPRDFFDAAIGNPPFGQIKIQSDPEYKKQGFLLHDYFFAKTIDRVKPGGLLVFVTSKGTMDKGSDRARKYLSERADLLGAIRLPQTAFKDNAGTEVVTDVIFLRKRMEGQAPAGEAWEGLKEVQTAQGPAMVNEYFADHPEMVLGKHAKTGSMYRADEYTVEPIPGDIEQLFAKAVENLPEGVYRAERGSTAERAAVQRRDYDPKVKKEGGIYVADDGTLMQVESGQGVPLTQRLGSAGKVIDLKPREIEWLKGYTRVRDALKQAQYDQLNDGAWEKSLKALNKEYAAFTKQHGDILAHTVSERENDDGTTTVTRRFKNETLVRLDAEGALAYALEVIKPDGTITKGAVLNGRTLNKPSVPQITSVQDAMFVSMNDIGRFDLGEIAKLSGKTKEAVIAELGDAIYQDPAYGWTSADSYLSGNVVRKLKEAESAARIDKSYTRNVEALKNVQPRALAPQDITVQLGSAWIPASDVQNFAAEVMGDKYKITHSQVTGQWSVDGVSSRVSEWGTGDKKAQDILEAVLNNRQLKVTFKDADGKTHTDATATEKVNDIAKKLRAEFKRWIWTDSKRADRLAKYYNENYNNIAPRKFDGSHLTLPGVSTRFDLRPHQKRAIWRTIQEGDTYYAHAVGAGKTFTMIAAGMEERRLGLVKKPMYVVPNHMLAQFSKEFLELYPTASIMVADETNFHTHNRRKFVAQAALNDPDAIVITHSAFGRIGMSAEYTEKFIQGQIDDWQAALEESDKSDRVTVKQIQRRIEQLENRLKATIDTKKDQVLNFEDLGVDRLYVDEGHEFRKLDFPTNRGNIKGIDSSGSQRSMDLYMKVQFIRGKNPGRALVMASGTPVTNTMGELFTVQRFFQQDQLEEDGDSSFDAWANHYGEVVDGLEQNAAGGYETVSRFAKFVNVPELMSRVRSFMDILTSEQLGDLVQRPDVNGGGRKIVVTPAPEGYKAYQKELENRIKAIRDRKGPPKPGEDIILNVIADGRFSAIDMRFVDPTLPSDPNSKLNVTIDRMIEAYKASADNEYMTDGKVDPIKGGALMMFTDIGLGEQSAKNRGFDMKAWIEKRLIEGGVKPEHIAFMRDHKAHAKKERLFDDMRQGKKRILIGGKDMETGVNAQKRLVYLGHLDAPWFPASVEQREGRIIRQGNQNKSVDIEAYASKGSYDSTMWGMNARKARFIEQAMSGDTSVRSMEDVSEASAFEMAAALASGDERYLKLAGLKGDVERLSRLYSAHIDDQRRLRSEKMGAEANIKHNSEQIDLLEKAIAKREPIKPGEFKGTVGGTTYDNREDFSAALYSSFKDLAEAYTAGEQTLGSIGGFPLVYNGVEMRGGSFGADLSLDIPGSPDPLINFPVDPGLSIPGIATRAANQVNGLDREATKRRSFIAESQDRLDKIERRLGASFPEQSELNEKREALDDLERELEAESKAANADAAAATVEAEGGPSFSVNIQRKGFQSAQDLETFLRGNVLGDIIGRRIDEGKIVLHDDVSAIPGAEGSRGVGGVTNIDGVMHLNAATLGKTNALSVALHETFHAGTEPLIGSAAWEKLLKRLGTMRNQAANGSPRMRALHKAAMERVDLAAGRNKLSERKKNEEFGAYLIEEYSNLPPAFKSWVDELIGAIKAWILRTTGLQAGQVTPEQLRALAVAALRSDAAMGAQFDFDPAMLEASLSAGSDRSRIAMQKVPTDSGRPAFRNEDGGLLYGVQSHADTTGDFDARERLPYGHRAHVLDDHTAWDFKAFRNGRHVANVTLQLDKAGNVDALHDIKVITKGQGDGEAVVASLIAGSRKPLRIIQAIPSAQDFWSKMGANGFFDLYDNTEIDWNSYEQNSRKRGKPVQSSGAVRRELPQDGKNTARGQADAGRVGGADPLDAESIDYLDNPDAWLIDKAGPSFSYLPDETALEDATKALDDKQLRPDFIGQLQQDLGRVAKYVLHPRQIAALHKDFTPVYKTAISQFEMRDSIIDELQQDHRAYDQLSSASKRKVNAILELGRLFSATYNRDSLINGVANKGEKTVVKFTEGGSTYREKQKVNALLSTEGEIIQLTEEEADAYLALRKMFDRALDKFRDQTLIDFGYPELAGKKDAAKQLIDMIKPETPAGLKDRLEGVARFIGEIEQAKRAGYVPFARYGDYVVAVKEERFPLKLIKNPDGGWLTRDLPLPYNKFLEGLGATWNELEGGYELDGNMRQALIAENNATVHSAKVEFTLRDKALLKAGRKVDELPSVKKALAEAEKWKAGNPARRIVAFEVIQKKPDGGLKLSDVDALAEVAMLDTGAWDAVREQLGDAIKGQSFRKHFFQSDNVPGYTEDFERSIADYMGGMAGYLARRHYNNDWENSVSKIKAPRLFEYANKYRAYANEPQEELAKLRQVGFLYYIAGVPATAFVNLTQPILMTIPVLGQIASMPMVIREMGRAYKDALKMVTYERGLDMFNPEKAPADIRADLLEAWAGGMFVPLQTYEIMATSRQRNVGSRKLAKGFNNLIQATALFFSFAERLNRLVTFIAAARLAVKPGVEAKARKVYGKNALARQTMLKNWSPAALADYMIDETQFRMGKANRPTIMRGVGALIMQFKGFVMQSLEAWFRLATQNGKEGAKAVALSIGSMVLIGGLWGFPGSDDLRDMIEKSYKQVTKQDLDLKTELRRGLYDLTGQRWIAEVASKGATYPYGLDLSRVGMGGIAPDTPLQVFGIPADLFIGRPTRAFQKGTQGDVTGALAEFLPNVLKNPITAYGWNANGVRDGAGRLLVDGEEISKGAMASKSLGFQPSQVTDIRDYEYAQRRMETANDQLKRSYTGQVAKLLARMEKYPEKRADLQTELDEVLAEVEAHNAKARGPEEMILITRNTIKERLLREMGGVKQTWGKERKQARGASDELREVFGLGEE